MDSSFELYTLSLLDHPTIRLSEAEIEAAIEFCENEQLVDYGEFPSPYADSSFYWDGRIEGQVTMYIGQPDNPNQSVTLDIHTGRCAGYTKHLSTGHISPLSLEQAARQFRHKLGALQIAWGDVCDDIRMQASSVIWTETAE